MAYVVVATAAAVGPAHADVILDVGRGPVTVHVPPSYDPLEPAPLLMLLHGYGASGALQESYMQLLPWSDRLGFLYVHPDGTVDQDGRRFWNATDACCDFYDSGVDDSGYLRTLIEAIMAELSVDAAQVYLLGHSNGGFMAYRMACDHADIITAVASLAGATRLDPADCTPLAPVRTLQIHGTADEVVLYEGGVLDVGPTQMGPYPGAVATAEQWAAHNQCSNVPDLTRPPLDLDRLLPGFETTVARYDDGCAPGGAAELWTIVDGGHIPTLSGDFVPLVLDFFLSGGNGGVLLVHRHVIPAAAYAAGAEGSFFQTDIDVANTGDSPGRYRFLWLPRVEDNADPLASDEFVLGPHMAARYRNAVHEIFGLEPDSLGAITIETNSEDLKAMSRTYTFEHGGDGTFGQAMPAVPGNRMITSGERRRILFASEDDDLRFNVGCQSYGAGIMVVNLELFDQQGTSLEQTTMILRSWGNDQLNRIFEDFMPVNGYVDVWTTQPGRSFYCYGSVLDNLTNDPTTIPPQ